MPSPWLFPGNPPSRPISEQWLSRRLKLIGVDCNQDRRAALFHLAGEIPAPILADIVGVHVITAGAWADIAGRPWGDYPALRDPGPGGRLAAEQKCGVSISGSASLRLLGVPATARRSPSGTGGPAYGDEQEPSSVANLSSCISCGRGSAAFAKPP